MGNKEGNNTTRIMKVETGEKTEIFLEQIATPERLQEVSGQGLTSLYQDVFSKFPYFIDFTEREATAIFNKYVTEGLLFIAKNDSEVIGFGAAVPFTSVPDLSELLGRAGRETDNAWYMADLGVKDEYRRKGLARKLVTARLDAIPSDSTVFIRTSVDNIPSQSLYRSLGFKQVPDVLQQVKRNRTDGTISVDDRIFFEKKI